MHMSFFSSRACALDVSKFCRDVPHGSGQQLKCLSNIMQENSKFKLENKCDKMLRQRLQMFDMALKVVPINGVQDLWVHVSVLIKKNMMRYFQKKILWKRVKNMFFFLFIDVQFTSQELFSPDNFPVFCYNIYYWTLLWPSDEKSSQGT